MDASWQAFLEVLPTWMRGDVDRLGRKDLRQLRLRMGDRPILELGDRVWRLERVTEGRDLDFCVNAASNYSPWSVDSAREGFLTIPGGHRLGLCGQTIVKEDRVTGFRKVSSLCFRVARDLKNVAPKDCASWFRTDIRRSGLGKDHPAAGSLPEFIRVERRGSGGQPQGTVSGGL